MDKSSTKKNKYIVITTNTDTEPTIKYYSSLRDIQTDIGIHYSVLSRHLRNNTYKSIGNNNPGRKSNSEEQLDSKFIIKRIIE